MMQTWENYKNSGRQNFFVILVVRHCSKLLSYAIQRKANEQNLRKWQKIQFSALFWLVCPNFGLRKLFSCVLLLLYLKYCRKLSLYAIWRKTYDPNSGKWRNWAWFRPIGPLGHHIFFFKNWLRQSLNIMVSYYHVKNQKKLLIQS